MAVMSLTRSRPGQPERFAPMLATLGALEGLGGDDGWGFEMKWDGVRALAYVDADQISLISRNDIDMRVS
jgi:bifunctional non-homologous end joining protein LigD